jgi:dihydropyrimidinase
VDEIAIRGGVVVTACGRRRADVLVRAGRIAAVAPALPAPRAATLDASGCFVLPGAFDPHVHLTTPPSTAGGPTWCDDLDSGTAAALAGGVTTVGNMTFVADDETPNDAMRRDLDRVRRLSRTDVVLHPVWSPADDWGKELQALAASGVRAIKLFMVDPAFDWAERSGRLGSLLRAAGRLGLVVMLHAEDARIVAAATGALAQRGEADFRHYGESRPREAEAIAAARAVDLALEHRVAVYLVHTSIPEVVALAVKGRVRGARVYVETRPLYLHLSEERMDEPDAAKYVGQPPLRTAADREALWRALADGSIDTVGSDHAAWRLADKLDPAHTLAHLRPGVANLEWELPMLYSEGVPTGRLTLERLVAVTAANPARAFGLYPRKGEIAPGSDADLVVLDPGLHRRVGPPYQTRAGYSVVDGWAVTGWPRFTVRRGEVAYADGRVLAPPGSGRMVG